MIYENLYKIKEKNNDSAIVILANENHPVFKAHFPTKPILPGFIHFDIVSEVFGIDIKTIKKAKFNKMILPLQTITYIRDNNKFKVLCDDIEVASFSL